MKWQNPPLFLIFFLAFVSLSACSKSLKPPLKGHKVFSPSEVIQFNHRCSEIERRSYWHWSSLAFFDKAVGDKSYKASALVRVDVGYADFNFEQPGVHFLIHKLRVQSLRAWAGQPFSLRVRLVNLNTNETMSGDSVKTFLHYAKNLRGGQRDPYQMASDGSYDYLSDRLISKFVSASKPETVRELKVLESGEYKTSADIGIDQNRISRPEDPHALLLVLTNIKTGANIVLKGPRIHDLKQRMEGIEKPNNKSLGFFESLKPGQKGGVFSAIRSLSRYEKCPFIQPWARQQFADRFTSQ